MGSSLVAQQVKDLALLLLWLRSLLWHEFNPWLKYSCRPRAQQKKKEEKEALRVLTLLHLVHTYGRTWPLVFNTYKR